MVAEADVGPLLGRLRVPAPAEDVIREALRDESWVNENPGRGLRSNKKLAFVGDAVVELAVRRELQLRHPNATRDDLSKLADELVQDVVLADAARVLEIGPLMELGNQRRGHDNATVLARAFEALFAAIFISSGYEEAARAGVECLFREPKSNPP